MLDQLAWELLQTRGAKMRLILMYKATNFLIALDSQLYLTPIQSITRHHMYVYRHIQATQNYYYKFSYYPRTIPLWNYLPTNTVGSESLEAFKTGLARCTLPAHLM